jgi:nucleotide-binding universal stress UspA family protein
MTTFHRILVPIDFSESSDAALEHARAIAGRFGASLHLVHAFEDPYAAAVFMPEVYGVISPEASEAARHAVGRRLNATLRGGDVDQGGSAEVILGGPPAKAVADYAASHHIDLIVMGTHGRRGVAHALLGSVAEQVVRTAPCAVLTVKQAAVPVPVEEVCALAGLHAG